MSHLLNTRASLVSDAIDGELLAAGGRLARLDSYPDIRVVLRADWDRAKVAIVSGGGAGHEPAHVGFIGRGMLTAAVCGDVFASPSSEAVLAAILAVAGERGVLLVIKNYTGDRLNFGLAAERARALGVQVETVIVGDDVALPGIAQPRGIAGTLFVHKVAGAAAEAGGNLATVASAARAVAQGIRSIGMATTTCTIPGGEAGNRIPEGEAEFGLGIHGEPGAKRGPLGAAREMVDLLLEQLVPPGESAAGPFALLINNLGALSPIELAVVTEAVLTSRLAARIELVFGPAPLMTALAMKGFSLSLLPLDPDRRAALLAPVDAKSWPRGERLTPLNLVPMPGQLMAEPVTFAGTSASQRFRSIIEAVLASLIEIEDALNRLDSKVGDGDTGTTVARAAKAVGDHLETVLRTEWGDTLLAIAQRTGQTMGGSSGVLVSIYLAATGTALNEGLGWPAALREGFDRVAFYGGASEGDRTMLDALAPAIRVLEQGGGLTAAAAAAKAGAARTSEILTTRSGRSSYLNATDLRGIQDPGAVAAATMLNALAQAVELAE